jgi:gluconolactonase
MFFQDKRSVVAAGATLTKLSGEFSFTEGPACDAEGNIYFTDQPNDRILKWSVDGKLTTFLSPSGRANGLSFDTKGNLWACADELNQLWCIAPNKKVTVVITSDPDQKLLNGPNDLWIHPKSEAIYFTDPLYARPYWKRDRKMQPAGQFVYCLGKDRKTLRPVATDLTQPNGIIGTPDGKHLFIADIGAAKTYLYKINPDGSLTDKKLFHLLGSDGLTLDSDGNLYLTGNGVTILNKNGVLIENISVPEGWTANVCFGGKDRKTLFITASRGLYSIQMKTKGVGSQ